MATPATWRLILEPQPRPGSLNLAVDEAILRTVAEGKAPPTLRLYGWAPSALTLGRGQPYADADPAALARAGFDLLRRMTGGTAVLNREELTYAVAVRRDDPHLPDAIAESYRPISDGLLAALQRLDVHGVSAGTGESVGARRRSPVCFEVPSAYEITVAGRKLVGSSQMRIRGGILQHGSLPLTGDIGDIGRYLTARPSAERIRSHALTLRDALGRVAGWSEVAEAVVAGLRERLNLVLQPGSLSPLERERIGVLMVEKYSAEEWTRRIA